MSGGPVSARRRGAVSDARVLLSLLRGRSRAGTHAESLDAFYGPQAHAYDRFRERLLPGREALMQALPLAAGARVLDFGAGTGRHWLFIPDRLAALGRLELIDLCEPLLEIARDRFKSWSQVSIVRADAQEYASGEPVDAVVFSYSLSMMADWRAAIRNARRQIVPGGLLAVIDFCSLPENPPAPLETLSRWDRWFWPRWFAHDGVHLIPEVLPALLGTAATLRLAQGRARLPYLPGARAPWFWWIGRTGARENPA